MNNSLIELFNRDIDRLKTEISAYNNEETLWKIDKNITNSGGNLALHLIGNLNHFIGAVLGNSGYIRQRDNEFNDKHIPRKQLLEELDQVKIMLKRTISTLKDTDYLAIYPINIRKEGMITQQFLIHLYGHLNYHLGQINYHRRLLD